VPYRRIKLTFAISSPDEFLFLSRRGLSFSLSIECAYKLI